MTPVRLILGVLLAALALAATACGGGSESVPEGAIANVDGTEITKEQLTDLMALSRSQYERTKQQFPKAGTPEYQSIQTRTVSLLVEIALFRQAAEDLGVEVTEKDIDKLENETIKTYFKGNEAQYEKALKKAGFTREEYRANQYEVSVLYQKIFDAVTKETDVTDQDIVQYYTANQSQYGTPESRAVRHILISEKDADGNIDFAASKQKADEVYAQLKAGASFAALAKQLSADTGTKDLGGKYTALRGQSVPEFDEVSFELKTGEISKPVKTQFGYHVIEALSDANEAKATPLAQVKESIRNQLLQQKKNEEMQTWVEDLKSDYEDKVSYAVGYEPPELPEPPTETQ